MGRRKLPYSLYLRRVHLPGKKKPTRVYYYRCYDPQGRRTTGRSTGCERKGDADGYCKALQAAGQLLTGPQAPARPEIPTLAEWARAEAWWVWGQCRYLRGQLNRSDPERPKVSRRYADDALRDLGAWILPYHGKKPLTEITPKDCENLLAAWQDKGLSRKTINNKASIYRIMLGEAERLKIIPESPWLRVKSFTPAEHPKGILTLEEAARLLNPATVPTVWKGNPIYHAASLTASLTGLRVGEVLALKTTDLFPDHLHVAHSWHIKYKEGGTKTKRVDDIPIPRFLYDLINGFVIWEGYVFSFSHGGSRAGDRPCTANRIEDALKAALVRIGIPEEERVRRTLSFHSWRSFANTYFQGRGISGEKVRAITRHSTRKMTTHYSAFALEHFADVAAAQEELVASVRAAPAPAPEAGK